MEPLYESVKREDDPRSYVPFSSYARPEPEAPVRALPVEAAESGEARDEDFEEWYRTRGFKLFGTGKRSAQQWYEQRKRAAKPAVAMNDPGNMLADLMDKAMRV